MKIIVTGTRGIPNILGGVETHCEELYSIIKQQNPQDEIIIIRRSAYVKKENDVNSFKNIKIKTLYSFRSKAFEAIIHTFLAVCYAGVYRPDILHIHAIGPNLLTPFARLLGLKVVMTHHGPDYERDKWGVGAKLFLRLGEWCGVKYANKVIVISETIKKKLEEKYGRNDCILIPNGVPFVTKSNKFDYLDKIGIEPNKYIFTLGRFVPEKGFDYLIKAYINACVDNNIKLVIAGDADHESDYSNQLKIQAQNSGIIQTGFIKGEALKQLFSYNRLFVLPSFYEGLPISLLEAMRYNCNILASDIDANREVMLPEDSYFQVGNIEILTEKIKQKLEVTDQIVYNMDIYDWLKIAKQTYQVYKLLKR